MEGEGLIAFNGDSVFYEKELCHTPYMEKKVEIMMFWSEMNILFNDMSDSPRTMCSLTRNYIEIIHAISKSTRGADNVVVFLHQSNQQWIEASAAVYKVLCAGATQMQVSKQRYLYSAANPTPLLCQCDLYVYMRREGNGGISLSIRRRGVLFFSSVS